MSDQGVIRLIFFLLGFIVGMLAGAVRYQRIYAMGEAKGRTLAALEDTQALEAKRKAEGVNGYE